MLTLRIVSFGSLQAWLDDRRIDLAGAKTRALLGYLAADPAIARSRGSLAALLWPDADDEKSKQSLRSALYQLRRGIDAASAQQASDGSRASDAFLRIDQTRVSFQDDALISSDVLDFKAAVQRIALHDHDDESPCEQCVGDLVLAADLYGGEFLTDVSVAGGVEFEDWLLLQREAFQNQALHVLDRLAQVHLGRNEHAQAHDRAFRILEINRYDEFAHRTIMSALAAQGQFDQAMAHYDSSVALLRNELGVEPSEELVELAVSLQAIASRSEAPVQTGRNAALSTHMASQTKPPRIPQSLPYLRNAIFVGRADELDELADRLAPNDNGGSQPPAAVITGIGGVGKTQLATEYAYRFGNRYAGGVHWVNCDDPESIAGEVAALGTENGLALFGSGDGLTTFEQVEAVRRYWLTGPPQLVIFDNCEDLATATEWLPKLGAVSTLFTSRKGDWPVELPVAHVQLRPWERGESVEYLTSVAQHLSTTDADSVASKVGDHPLALRLAARFLARLPSLPAAEYIRQLEASPVASHVSLQATGEYSPTDSEQSVERAFAMSLQRVVSSLHADTAMQALARIAGVAPGVGLDRMFLLETMADVTDASAMIDADYGVQNLLDHGLVTNDEHRHLVMHRLVKDFVLRSLAEQDLIADALDAIELRIASTIERDQFAGPTERFAPPVSRTHMTHIVQGALDRGSQYAPLLALALGRNLREDWESVKAMQCLQAGIEVASDIGAVHDEGRLLLDLVIARMYYGQADGSLDLALRARDIFEATEPVDKVWLAVAFDKIAVSHLNAGAIDEAKTAADRSLELSREAGNVRVLARCLRAVASIECWALGGFTAATELLTEALELLDPVDHQDARATTLEHMGDVATSRGDYAKAVELHLGSAQLHVSPTAANVSYVWATQALLDDGKPAEALEMLGRTEADGFGGSVQMQVFSDLCLAHAHALLGDDDQALEMLQRSFAIDIDLDDFGVAAQRWRVAGIVAASRKSAVPLSTRGAELVGASECFQNARELLEEAGAKNADVVVTLFESASWEAEQGHDSLATDLAGRATALAAELGATDLSARYEHLLARAD